MSDKQDLKEKEVTENKGKDKNEETLTAEQEAQQEEQKDEKLDELEALQQELGELKDQNLRLYAEFENFRKRTAKERVELFSTANQELMDALLPILDDFNRAAKANDEGKLDEGTQLIYNKLFNTLKNKGLKPMDSAVGDDFDVDKMEAITRIPAPDDKLKGKVIDIIEPGYTLGNKILRYAKVVVGE